MAYFDKYGVEYSDDRKKLIRCPEDFQGAYAIPEGVTQIGGEVTWNEEGIHLSVIRTGRSAFTNCTMLTAVFIPDSVISIGDYAFCKCKNLRFVSIPQSVKVISNSAFYGCHKLSSIEIPNSVECIGDHAFEDCTNLSSVSLAEGIISIGNRAFDHCSSLTKITLPSTIANLGYFVFAQCSKLSTIEIHSNSNKLDFHEWAFQDDCCAGGHISTFDEIIVPKGGRRLLRQMGLGMYEDIIKEQGKQKCAKHADPFRAKFLFFDTETTGIPRNYEAPVTNLNNWPRLVQLAWITADKEGNVFKKKSVIIKPDGFSIPDDAVAVHGITTEQAQKEGIPLADVLDEFSTDLAFAQHIVGHNIDFDQHIVGAELCRMDMDYEDLMNKPSICTMESSVDLCAIPSNNSYYGGYKWPTLQELYQVLFDRSFEDAHDALADITATMECFFELEKRGII